MGARWTPTSIRNSVRPERRLRDIFVSISSSQFKTVTYHYDETRVLPLNNIDLQVIHNNALRLCLGIRLTDRISLVEIHRKANLVGLEQRRCIQLLPLLYSHGTNNPDVYHIPPRNTRAANRRKFKL